MSNIAAQYAFEFTWPGARVFVHAYVQIRRGVEVYVRSHTRKWPERRVAAL
jgi:hypothetical protein